MVIYFILGLISIISFLFYILLLTPIPLSKKQKYEILKRGLIHITNAENGHCILSTNEVYSNKTSNYTYFFINVSISGAQLKQNRVIDMSYAIVITNISHNQLKRMKIRNYDKAILFKGSFIFEDNNIVHLKPINQMNISHKGYSLMRFIIILGLISLIISVITFISLIIILSY